MAGRHGGVPDLVPPACAGAGPMWPKVSTFYTFYFDIIKGGLYYREIERMHREYGMLTGVMALTAGPSQQVSDSALDRARCQNCAT